MQFIVSKSKPGSLLE